MEIIGMNAQVQIIKYSAGARNIRLDVFVVRDGVIVMILMTVTKMVVTQQPESVVTNVEMAPRVIVVAVTMSCNKNVRVNNKTN